jgi:hypothetical protein
MTGVAETFCKLKDDEPIDRRAGRFPSPIKYQPWVLAMATLPAG